MNVLDTSICFFFFSLGSRNTGLINAEILVQTGKEGGNITVACKFKLSGKTKIFSPISSQPTTTVQPLSASVPSASTETTTQSVSSSTGSCSPPSAPPEPTKTTQKTQTTAGVLLYVRLPLVVMVIVLSASVLIICSKRCSREPPVESDSVNVSQANEASDEISEEEASPGLEMSAVQTFH
ncbi:uncharacterized protein LOC144388737 isoform X3 [Gasterosteus aculeatus]